jgi:hypothetical protein
MRELTRAETIEYIVQDWYTNFCVYSRSGLTDKEAFFKALKPVAERIEDEIEGIKHDRK